MRKLATTIVCIIISSLVSGQVIKSISLDSILNKEVNKLPDKYKLKFDKLLSNTENKAMLKRLDTLPFDYLIIEESFCYYNPQFKIVELYYLQSDSLPNLIYENGIKYFYISNPSSTIILYRTDLDNKLIYNELWNSLLSNQQFQTFKYTDIQHYYAGCAFDARNVNVRKASKEHRKEMESTYKIQILISKVTNETRISFQTPPMNLKFTMKYGGANWW